MTDDPKEVQAGVMRAFADAGTPPLLNKDASQGQRPDGPTLHPAVIAKLTELGFPPDTDDSRIYTPNQAMAATMHAARDFATTLAERLGNNDFWDGGDDIDYVMAGGCMLNSLTTAISGDCDEGSCTTLLNTLAAHDPNAWENTPDDEDEDADLSEDDREWFNDLSTAGSGGFHSAILDAVEGCAR